MYKDTDSDILKSLVQTSFDLMKLSPKGSIQRQVTRAMLVISISKTSILRELSTYCNHPRIDAGTQYTQAKADYATMQKGCIVSKTDYTIRYTFSSEVSFGYYTSFMLQCKKDV